MRALSLAPSFRTDRGGIVRARYSSFVLTVLLSALVPAAVHAQRTGVTVITGTLLNADGAPLKAADVLLYPPNRPRQLARAEVERDGRFAIATAGRGLFHLRFAGVDHAPATIPLSVEAPATIAVEVRLQRYSYADTLKRIAAVGDWNRFSSATARPLVRQPDGRYTLDVEATADTLAYQLIGLEAGGSGRRGINGPQAERYVYDDDGGYRSVIRARNGRATIFLDPTRLDRRPSTLSIAFRDPRSPAALMYALCHDWDRQRAEYFEARRLADQRHDSLRYDWAPIVARRSAALARERDPMRRQMLLLELLDAAQFGATIGRQVAQQIVREVPPSSPFWTEPDRTPRMIAQAFDIAAGVTGNQRDTAASLASLAYLDRVVAEQPDSELQAMALFGALRIARALGDAVRTNDYFSRLVTEYPSAAITALERPRTGSNSVWQVGAQVPAFRLAALDDTSVSYTPETFAGKIYLLGFWATWCEGCMRDMPSLHAAYDSLAAQGLEILSVSFDNSPAEVRRFRAGPWRMPWLHAFVPEGFDDAQIRRLEIVSLPRLVMVGRDGRMLPVDEALHFESLTATIRRALRASPSP
jgi:thiol-disulfide isomerase/thioredoxin